jgi:hypothetical protein
MDLLKEIIDLDDEYREGDVVWLRLHEPNW